MAPAKDFKTATSENQQFILQKVDPLQSFMLRAKLHKACVSHAELDYEGSCAIDGNLLDSAGIREFEQIQIYNISNGERFTTYAIRAESGSGIISVNGAAAHKANVGDKVIICAFGSYTEAELLNHKPKLVYLDESNTIIRSSNNIPIQVA
jgi:aspartate 1-decarboxylase